MDPSSGILTRFPCTVTATPRAGPPPLGPGSPTLRKIRHAPSRTRRPPRIRLEDAGELNSQITDHPIRGTLFTDGVKLGQPPRDTSCSRIKTKFARKIEIKNIFRAKPMSCPVFNRWRPVILLDRPFSS